MSRLKTILLFLWDRFAHFRIRTRQTILYRRDARFVRRHNPPQVLSIGETLDRIADEELSAARFGDGEIKLTAGRDISFQKNNPALQSALARTLSCDVPGFLVCIPPVFGERSFLLEKHDAHWKKHLSEFRPVWYKYLHEGKTYGNAFLSRCYVLLRDKSPSADYFRRMKRIWAGRDLLIVEGEKSRLGIGNDLFADARSVTRILGPAENAFDKHDALLEAAKRHGKDKLILLALGPTATVLSLELFEAGYRAVDLGHADIEYEWFLSGAQDRVPVKNKFVNEAGAGRGVGDLADETYQSQIAERVL